MYVLIFGAAFKPVVHDVRYVMHNVKRTSKSTGSGQALGGPLHVILELSFLAHLLQVLQFWKTCWCKRVLSRIKKWKTFAAESVMLKTETGKLAAYSIYVYNRKAQNIRCTKRFCVQ